MIADGDTDSPPLPEEDALGGGVGFGDGVGGVGDGVGEMATPPETTI